MLPLESHLKIPQHPFVEDARVRHRQWKRVGTVISTLHHQSGLLCRVQFEGIEQIVLVGIEWLELC